MPNVAWRCPIPRVLVPTTDGESFSRMGPDATGLPLAPHPGGFGVQRKHHVHEGVDLYCPPGTRVCAVQAGEVVAVLPFTGPSAGLAWWQDTHVVLVEGEDGVVAYGEIEPLVRKGQVVAAGELLGQVLPVLRHDKGRPTSMLHLELHAKGTRGCPPWDHVDSRPASLRDPTEFLLRAIPFTAL